LNKRNIRLITLTGVTASGKDTLLKEVCKVNKDLIPIISWTTRPKREGETEGVEYHFVSKEEFLKEYNKEGHGDFVEAREYNTKSGKYYYGVNKNSIDLTKDGDYIVILDSQGVRSMRYFCKENNIELVSYYIDCDYRNVILRSLDREPNATNKQILEMNRRIIDDDIAVNTRYIRERAIILDNNSLEKLYVNTGVVANTWTMLNNMKKDESK